MKLNKSQGDLLKRVIEQWEAEGTIDMGMADRLKESYTVRSFEWKELAKYSFWIAIICGVIAVVSVLADHLIMGFSRDCFFLLILWLAACLLCWRLWCITGGGNGGSGCLTRFSVTRRFFFLAYC